MEPTDEVQRRRLRELQANAAEAVSSWRLEKLTVPDLLLLLRHDPTLQQLVRSLTAVTTPQAEAVEGSPRASDQPPAGSPISALAPPVAPPADPLRQQVGAELGLLQALRTDSKLASEWLSAEPESEGRQLVRLIARAAQWDVVLELWDTLALRCKTQQRAVSTTELNLLQGALALHNLRWQDRQAALLECQVGADYDYRRMQRATPSGETVRALWLPGLRNAGAEVQKLPLVQT